MKSFLQFLGEEISIKGNKGIPEEKLREIERKGAEKVRGTYPHEVGMRLMNLLQKSKRYTAGKQQQLEKLAKEAMYDHFGTVLANTDIEVNLTDSGRQVGQFMKSEDEARKKKDEELKKKLQDKLEKNKDKESHKDINKNVENFLKKLGEEGKEELDPQEVKLAVDKRKLMNNIVQGEAKNVKLILHSEFVKDALSEIYGDNFQDVFNTWDEMIKLADKLDWLLDPVMRGNQMENNADGFAGACSTDFPEPEFDEFKSDEEKEEDDKRTQEILKSLEDGNIPKDSEEVKKALGKTTIKAIGIDFPMLLHELVKGAYELIVDVAMPRHLGLAKEVHKQTSSFADEAEDWKYGPYLASDLNNFIMKSPSIDKYPNLKEYVFGKLIDSDRWTDEECLKNLKNIFLESPEARTLVNSLVQEAISELDEAYAKVQDYQRQKREYEEEQEFRKREQEEEIQDVPEWWKDEDEKPGQSSEKEKQRDYSEMTQREIQELIDQALDDEDYETVKFLSQFLKEGKEIYLNEIERINESHKFHTRRND